MTRFITATVIAAALLAVGCDSSNPSPATDAGDAPAADAGLPPKPGTDDAGTPPTPPAPPKE